MQTNMYDYSYVSATNSNHPNDTDTHANTRTRTQHDTQHTECAMANGSHLYHHLRWRTTKRRQSSHLSS